MTEIGWEDLTAEEKAEALRHAVFLRAGREAMRAAREQGRSDQEAFDEVLTAADRAAAEVVVRL